MSAIGQTLIIVCPLVFLAGFVDSIAGGGGIISMPAYLLAGLPAHMAMGTNKFASAVGGTIATIKYACTGNLRLRPALMAAVTSAIAAWCGSRLVMSLDERILQLALMVALPLVAVFLASRKNYGGELDEQRPIPEKRVLLYSAGIGLGCGFYDGVVGPGTGTFLILAFTGVLGYGLTTSSGCAKLVNLASSIGSLLAFLFGGKVLFAVGVPAALSSALGSYLGARCAVAGGAKFIRPVIFAVLGLLFVKLALDYLGWLQVP